MAHKHSVVFKLKITNDKPAITMDDVAGAVADLLSCTDIKTTSKVELFNARGQIEGELFLVTEEKVR